MYFVLEKSEAFNTFNMFKAFVEKQSGLFVKCLRLDRGGEYNSSEFKDFSKEHETQRQLTIAYTPQKNGVAERKNRTIMNMVRAVLSEKEVLKIFWADAVLWANHYLNRSPTSIVKDMTPEEAWSQRKPSVNHFRVFGCIGHVHISDVKRTKLDDKSVNCVLMGFSNELKGYKIIVEKKMIISRNVIFEEDRAWECKTIGYAAESNMELVWEDEHEPVINEEERDVAAANEEDEEGEEIETEGAAENDGGN